MNSKQKVTVGIGIIILSKEGKILIGKRKGNYVPKFSIPGGSLEPGETFEDAAIRETYEETNITIKNPQVIAITNNLETYKEEGKHTISVILLAKIFTGKPIVVEPEK